MKKYILLKPEPVQSQISTTHAGAKASVLFVGLDVHNDSIAVSIAPSDSSEVRRYGIMGGEHDDVLKLAKKLQAAHSHPARTPRPQERGDDNDLYPRHAKTGIKSQKPAG